ncbi:unnamed protein product [Mucor hiemalis]
MNLLSFIPHGYHFVNNASKLNLLKEVFIEVWEKKILITKCKKRAIKLRESVTHVLNSRPAALLIENNVLVQSEAVAVTRLTTHISDQICSVPSSSSTTIDSVVVKKRKRLMPKDFKELNVFNKVKLLVDSCGINKILGSGKDLMIPQRSQAVANKIAMKLEILLPPTLEINITCKNSN